MDYIILIVLLIGLAFAFYMGYKVTKDATKEVNRRNK